MCCRLRHPSAVTIDRPTQSVLAEYMIRTSSGLKLASYARGFHCKNGSFSCIMTC